MHYTKIYYTLIETRKQLNRVKSEDYYYEQHHIVPRSLGGLDSNDNLILLTPREHFLAHKLLCKMHTGKSKAKMAYALLMMCSSNAYHKRTVSSRQYEYARTEVSKSCRGENNPLYGKNPFTPEQLDRMRAAKQGSNNPMYGKTPWNKGAVGMITQTEESNIKRSQAILGRSRSQETKNKISAALQGKQKSKEHRLKLSEANLGKTLTNETKKKMSDSRKGKECKELICPVCGKHGKSSAMYRWHFANCKKN